MISDERLEDMANNPFNRWDGSIIGEVAKELIDARATITEQRRVNLLYQQEVSNLEIRLENLKEVKK